MLHRLLVFILIAVYSMVPASAEPYFSSGPSQVVLLELYSSEGCSSCPPADKWLSSLVEHEALFTKIIPVAFQVDYWDYLGWRDPNAKAEHSARQRKYARAGFASGVYTPGLFLNGREWRNWRRGKNPQLSSELVGELELEKSGTNWKVTFDSSHFASEKLRANVALLGFDVTSSVPRGENAGRKLQHDFVVLEWQSEKLKNDFTEFKTAELRHPNKKLAIVTWISKTDQTPIQATGGWITP